MRFLFSLVTMTIFYVAFLLVAEKALPSWTLGERMALWLCLAMPYLILESIASALTTLAEPLRREERLRDEARRTRKAGSDDE